MDDAAGYFDSQLCQPGQSVNTECGNIAERAAQHSHVVDSELRLMFARIGQTLRDLQSDAAKIVRASRSINSEGLTVAGHVLDNAIGEVIYGPAGTAIRAVLGENEPVAITTAPAKTSF